VSTSDERYQAHHEPIYSPFEVWTYRALIFFAVGFFLLVIFTSKGLFSAVAMGGGKFSQSQIAQVTHTLDISTKLMIASLAGLVTAISVRNYRSEFTGYLFLLAAIVLYIGAPFVVSQIYPQGLEHLSDVTRLVLLRFRWMATILLLPPGLFFTAMDLLNRMTVSARVAAMRKQRLMERGEEEAPAIRPMGKCFQTRYCRDFIRKVCPVFYSGKACWKYRVGCYCDEKIILGAVKTESSPMTDVLSKDWSERYLAGIAVNIGNREGKERCRGCFLYQEHQKEKYRFVSPLAFPAAFGILFWGIPHLRTGYYKFIGWSEAFLQKMSFIPKPEEGPAAQQTTDYWFQSQSAYEGFFWFVALMAGIMCLTYCLRFVDWVIYDMQW